MNKVASITHASKSFGKLDVLKDVSVQLPSGTILGLIGPSGAGKTTLIKCLLGMEKLDNGSVEIFNTTMPNRKILAKIGYMGQSDALYEDLSAKENLTFFGNLMNIKGNELDSALEIAGSLGWVLITNLLLALVALSMGLFVSTFAHSEFQMVQFIPLIIIPQIFFSGLIPLDTMADWVKTVSYIFPLSYAANTLSAVMIKGQGFSYIWPDLAILALFGIVFTFLNIVGLKKYRKV